MFVITFPEAVKLKSYVWEHFKLLKNTYKDIEL